MFKKLKLLNSMIKGVFSTITTLTIIASVHAAQITPPVLVQDAWVRGTVSGQQATGAFMRLKPSKTTRLIGASSTIAHVVEVHEMRMSKNHVMQMRQIHSLSLPADQETALKPGSFHLMLIGLERPLADGDLVPISLTFEDVTQQQWHQEIMATVRGLGAQSKSPPHSPPTH